MASLFEEATAVLRDQLAEERKAADTTVTLVAAVDGRLTATIVLDASGEESTVKAEERDATRDDAVRWRGRGSCRADWEILAVRALEDIHRLASHPLCRMRAFVVTSMEAVNVVPTTVTLAAPVDGSLPRGTELS